MKPGFHVLDRISNTGERMHKELPKQVIVVRKDLNMRKGKIAAQVAHASLKAVMDAAWRSTSGPDNLAQPFAISIYGFRIGSPIQEWLDNGCFTKICVYVESEKDLDLIFENAKTAGIPAALIIDNGLTEFNGVHTKTCVAVGPDYPSRIDPITGRLPLL
jgi:PTH2 family peptidyl-tRNA hydrolase